MKCMDCPYWGWDINACCYRWDDQYAPCEWEELNRESEDD